MMFDVSVKHSASLCTSFFISLITHAQTETWSVTLSQGCNTVKSNVVVQYTITCYGPFEYRLSRLSSLAKSILKFMSH